MFYLYLQVRDAQTGIMLTLQDNGKFCKNGIMQWRKPVQIAFWLHYSWLIGGRCRLEIR